MSAPVATTALPVATPKRTRAVVGALVRTRLPLLTLTTLTLVASTTAVLVVPPLLGGIVDTVVEGGPAGRLDLLAAGVLAAVIVMAVLGALGTTLLARLGEGVLAELRERVVDRALRAPLVTVERGG